MEMQKSDAEDQESLAGDESYMCESCPFVLIVLLIIGIVLDIIAIVYYAIVPSQKRDVLIVLGVSLSCVVFACGVITYFRTRRSSTLSNNLQSSSEEIYDVPWNISKEAEDYGIMNPGMQSSFPRYTTEIGTQLRKQRHSKHPIKLSEQETMEYESTDEGELFSDVTSGPELLQHQMESRNEMEYSQSSFEVRDEHQRRSHEREEWLPINSFEATGHRYKNSNTIDRRELEENEHWSRKGRCRTRHIQEYEAEPDVLYSKSAKLSKQQRRSKSEASDYKAGRNMTVREQLFLNNRQSKQTSPNYNKCSVSKETEKVEYKNLKKKKPAKLATTKSDSNICLSKRKRDLKENENKGVVYNQKGSKYTRQIAQRKRKTLEYPSNRSENIDSSRDACSPASKTYKNYPTVHTQRKVPLHLSSERERMEHVPEYGRMINCSSANAQRIGKYTVRTSNGFQEVQSNGRNRNNFAFETGVTAYSPRSRKIMHFQSPNDAGTRTLSPKFTTGESRYLGRSSIHPMTFSPGRNENLERHESVKYPTIGKGSSAKYPPACREGPNYFSEQTAAKSSFQAAGGQEQNLWVNSSHMRQNLSYYRKTKDSRTQATNQYSKAVNQPLNCGSNRYIIRNDGMICSRNLENQIRTQQRIAEHQLPRNEMGIDSIGSNTEYMSYPERYSTASVVI